MFDLAVTRFAWAARHELGVDVALVADNEDELVEAMARFLWAHRRHTPAADGGPIR